MNTPTIEFHPFTIIEGAQVIVHSRGVYRQVKVFQRGDRIYAQHGSGYVKLYCGGATSAPNIRWAEIDPGDGSYVEAAGKVTYIAEDKTIDGTPALEAAE